MDAEGVQTTSKEMVDYVADYLENIRERRPLPTVKPGYLAKLIPEEAPQQPEAWEDVFKDIERVIMPGVTHWHSPQFHAYFPTGNSYVSICADMLSDAIGCIGFSWSHSSVERAGLLGAVTIRKLATDENFTLRGAELQRAIKKDRAAGHIPFFLCATLGTTSSCAFDNIRELGPICTQEGVWMHIDAAYAGSSFICPEYRHLLEGVEFAESFNFNPHKWMLVNFDCSAMWIHWQIPLGRRFRSLKLWFVLRLYGVSGLQEHIRRQISLAQEFKAMLLQDERFDLIAPVTMGLVCFRLKGSNDVSERLLKRINDDGRIHMVPSKIRDVYFLRFAVCAASTHSADVRLAWDVIAQLAGRLLAEEEASVVSNKMAAVSLGVVNGEK
ncbi:PREDICTED: aromatic-L-amino-acid decarboxylase-like [Priapulus caudatus]|uniref:Aromatic-L-amino-acid decarboxylase n=1 Tax=Priapulus caudatus TaxID=37621 RepID=A0ABM1E6M8_PRICU|nr:PREDICTED: aromatic-L-amino-acid decarboxylase-like [Priapulus caudatus]